MSSNTRSNTWNRDTWAVVDRHDWGDDEPLEVTLARTFTQLSIDGIVYDYIDIEAVMTVFGAESNERGAHAVRFHCEDHEVQISADGTIAARSHPE